MCVRMYLCAAGLTRFVLSVYAGVTYVTSETEKKLTDDLFPPTSTTDTNTATATATASQKKKKAVVLTKDSDIAFVRDTTTLIRQFDETKARDLSLPLTDRQLLLPSCNSFLRLALRQMLETDFPHLLVDLKGRLSKGASQTT